MYCRPAVTVSSVQVGPYARSSEGRIAKSAMWEMTCAG